MKISHLCDLIKACSESGVTELQFENLRVTFNSKSSDTKRTELTQIQELRLEPSDPAFREYGEAEKRAIRADELNIREDDLAMKLITDPAEYERLLVSGELDA
jgi:hypothetical protein